MDTSTGSRGSRLLWVSLALAGAGVLGYTLWLVLGQPAEFDSFANHGLYNGALLAVAVACFARAWASPRMRGAWIAFGIGLALWTAGDVYWVAVLENTKKIPYPSPADLGYLLAIPCFFVAIGLMAHDRLGRATPATWFDGGIAALAAAAGTAALLGPALIGLTRGEAAAVLTNLAYPLGDVILIGFIAALVAVSGVSGARALLTIGAGLLIWSAGDAIYLWSEATGTYTTGWLDLFWPVGALLIGASAALSLHAPTSRRRRYRPGFAVPMISTAVVVTVLVWDHFERLPESSIGLAAATIVLVAARLIASFRDNERLVGILHDDSVTDQLTELGNRRALLADLDSVLAEHDAPPSSHLFSLFDLDGFKAYNDSFGHPAGDALLHRLGANLRAAIGPFGTPYRLGGDEFCVLIRTDGQKTEPLIELARAALTERGEGFRISASGGSVILPREAADASAALRLADQRLYAEKAERSTRTGDQTQTVLLRILRAREPGLGDHSDGVAELALAVGRALALDNERLDVLGRAAELHDIGKIAIPEDVLHKDGPLSVSEWELMRRHTLIGERILGSTKALAPVAKVVRSSHERWDGLGYPDGIAGETIPLEARIIFVCDAFDAMTSERPYAAAITAQEAIAELRSNAGSQFDPMIVEAFCALDQVHEAGAKAAARPLIGWRASD